MIQCPNCSAQVIQCDCERCSADHVKFPQLADMSICQRCACIIAHFHSSPAEITEDEMVSLPSGALQIIKAAQEIYMRNTELRRGLA